jgi:hypothetical protein
LLHLSLGANECEDGAGFKAHADGLASVDRPEIQDGISTRHDLVEIHQHAFDQPKHYMALWGEKPKNHLSCLGEGEVRATTGKFRNFVFGIERPLAQSLIFYSTSYRNDVPGRQIQLLLSVNIV